MRRSFFLLLFILFVLAGIHCSGGGVSLSSSDPDERRTAIIKLAAREKVEYIPTFIEILQKDSDYLVRAQAAVALGDLKATSAVLPLIKALEDHNQWVRADAAIALGKLGDLRATEPLITLLAKETYSGVRRAIVHALTMLKDLKAIPALIVRLEDVDLGVSSIAYQSLCEISGLKLPKDVKAWQEWYNKTRK